jgi:tRNA threonylcarbamoyladenosine biosynthesis protein TsaE
MIPSETRSRSRRVLTVETRSADQTRSLAAHLAAVAEPGDRLALIGPLGAGKTQFAKGYAAGLGVTAIVNSPSFTLMAEYEGRLPLFHQDLYRLAGSAEALEGGLLDERQDSGVTLSEWAERLDGGIDSERLEVRIGLVGDEERRIQLVAADGYERYLDAGAAWAADADRRETAGDAGVRG